MKKPERVEAGQWWDLPLYGDPARITGVIGEWVRFGSRLAAPLRIFGNDDVAYLGSGEHPEPSEWMIETLAEHLYAVTVAGVTDEPMTSDDRAEAGRDVRAILQGRPVLGNAEGRAAVLSLYRILRSLGKW